jgi:hypothetical protein
MLVEEAEGHPLMQAQETGRVVVEMEEHLVVLVLTHQITLVGVEVVQELLPVATEDTVVLVW